MLACWCVSKPCHGANIHKSISKQTSEPVVEGRAQVLLITLTMALMGVTVNQHTQNPGQTIKSVINILIIYTCAFPTVTGKINILCEKGQCQSRQEGKR